MVDTPDVLNPRIWGHGDATPTFGNWGVFDTPGFGGLILKFRFQGGGGRLTSQSLGLGMFDLPHGVGTSRIWGRGLDPRIWCV